MTIPGSILKTGLLVPPSPLDPTEFKRTGFKSSLTLPVGLFLFSNRWHFPAKRIS